MPEDRALEPDGTLLAWAWPDGFGALLHVEVPASPAPVALAEGRLTTAEAPFAHADTPVDAVAREFQAPPNGWNAHDDASIGLRHPTGEVLPIDVVALKDIDGCGIRSSTPPDGDQGVNVFGPVRVHLEAASASTVAATMTELPGGAAVSATATASGTKLVLRPDAALAPDREHRVTLDTPCGRTVSFEFTTDSASTRESPGGEGTYLLDPSRLETIYPAIIGSFFSSLLDDTHDRLALTLVRDGSTASMSWTTYTDVGGGNLDQDACATNAAEDALSWSTDRWVASVDPTDPVVPFLSGPPPLPLQADITRLEIIPSDSGEALLAVFIDATWDVRDSLEVFADLIDVADAEEICTLFGGFGVSCAHCTDAQPYCIDVSFAVYGLERAATNPSPRTASAIEADPTCEGALWDDAATPWGEGVLDGLGCSSAGPRPLGALAVLLAILGLRRRRG